MKKEKGIEAVDIEAMEKEARVLRAMDKVEKILEQLKSKEEIDTFFNWLEEQIKSSGVEA